MAERPGLRQPPGVVAIILLICTLAGLLAGVGTRQLVGGVPNGRSGSQDRLSPKGTTGSGSPTSTSDPLPAATATTVSVPGGFSGFTVLAQVTPASVAPGQQFTITATVIAKDGVTPLGGVLCNIGAAEDGNGPLLQVWPSGVVSNTNGEATWTLQAPNVSDGIYTVKVSATGARGYYYYTVASLMIGS